MVKVINIKPEYELILGFLYPNYAITDSLSVTSKFITHRNVKSKIEREALDLYYTDGVFISSQIFDEIWDEDKIKQECIEFSRLKFKNRKKTIITSSDTFIQDCVNFIFQSSSEEEDLAITKLFDSFGSAEFISQFVLLSEKIPYQKLTASMITFLSKIKSDSNSAFYKKKALLYEKKINDNMLSALDNYNNSNRDESGLNECSFFVQLLK